MEGSFVTSALAEFIMCMFHLCLTVKFYFSFLLISFCTKKEIKTTSFHLVTTDDFHQAKKGTKKTRLKPSFSRSTAL